MCDGRYHVNHKKKTCRIYLRFMENNKFDYYQILTSETNVIFEKDIFSVKIYRLVS